MTTERMLEAHVVGLGCRTVHVARVTETEWQELKERKDEKTALRRSVYLSRGSVCKRQTHKMFRFATTDELSRLMPMCEKCSEATRGEASSHA